MTGLLHQNRGARTRASTLLASCAAVLIVPLCVTACSKKQQKPPQKAVPVTVATVRRMAVSYTVQANGLVTPLQTAVVSSQVDGIITQVTFREGQDVSKGEVLFRIEPRPYRAAYLQALATLARDRATAENARLEVQRYDTLVKQDYVTKEQADQERATFGAANATVQADEAAVEAAKFNLDNTVIRAPIAGRTGGLLVRQGNLVHAASGIALVVINQIKPILVHFAVPSTNLPLIQQYGAGGGLAVTAIPGIDPAQENSDTTSGPQMSDASTSSDAPTTKQINIGLGARGALSFIDNAVDTTTGTVDLKATFVNTAGTLWPGEFVATSMRLFVEQNALVVPAQAVVTGQQGTYVYVVDSTSSARQRSVTVERTAGNLVVIASGLNAGERVVTDGQSRINPGAKVSMQTASANAAGKGGAGHSPRTSTDSAAPAAVPSAVPHAARHHKSQ